MSKRALIETWKFFSASELLTVVCLVCTQWRKAVLSEEILLFLLTGYKEEEVCMALSPYQRLQKAMQTTRYLLHLAKGRMIIWDLQASTAKTTIRHNPIYVHSSRYVLLSASTAMVTGGKVSVTACLKVDLKDGKTVSLPAMLKGHLWHGVARLDREVYVSGGGFMPQTVQYAEKFEGGRWTEIADMTTPRYNHTLCPYLQRIYAFGGSNSVCLDSIEYYDGVIWTLALMDMPSPSNYCSVTAVPAGLLLVTGFIPFDGPRLIYLWTEEGKDWKELGPVTALYSRSNALSLQRGVLYMFDCKPSQSSFVLTLT